jgi:hypothetical protein
MKTTAVSRTGVGRLARNFVEDRLLTYLSRAKIDA